MLSSLFLREVREVRGVALRCLSDASSRTLLSIPSSAATSSPSPEPSTPAPTTAETPAAASPERLHSTDIAYKPTTEGWGYSPVYAMSFDRIFGDDDKKKKDTT